jgi:hypothetical protein
MSWEEGVHLPWKRSLRSVMLKGESVHTMIWSDERWSNCSPNLRTTADERFCSLSFSNNPVSQFLRDSSTGTPGAKQFKNLVEIDRKERKKADVFDRATWLSESPQSCVESEYDMAERQLPSK